MKQLPLAADEIDLKWRIDEGGIGLVAGTDPDGAPYISIYPLNSFGEAMGMPARFQHGRLMCRLVAGYSRRQPIIVFIDAEVTMRGLTVLYVPPLLIKKRGYDRHRFVAWGEEAPSYRLTICPANSVRSEPAAGGGADSANTPSFSEPASAGTGT